MRTEGEIDRAIVIVLRSLANPLMSFPQARIAAVATMDALNWFKERPSSLQKLLLNLEKLDEPKP